MKSLQRLQQHILASDRTFARGIELTPRAERLRSAFRRGIAVGMTASVAMAGAVGYAVKVGPGSYDAKSLYFGNASDSRVMASIYDNHRHLMAAKERVREIKTAMITGEASPDLPTSLEEQVAELRRAQRAEQEILQTFRQQTQGLSQQDIAHILGGDAQDTEQVANADASESPDDEGSRASRRFRP